MILEPSASLKLYLPFLLLVCMFTTIKLVRVWGAVSPFSRRPPTENPTYRGLLRKSTASLQHWITFTYLVSGVFASTAVYRISDNLLGNGGSNFIVAIASLTRQLSVILTMALLVALYAFLARWHISRRIENLD